MGEVLCSMKTIIIIEFIYLFIYFNAITSYILIIYELSNFDHVFGVVLQNRVTGENRIHDNNSLAHYPLDYQGTYNWKRFVKFTLTEIGITYLKIKFVDG